MEVAADTHSVHLQQNQGAHVGLTSHPTSYPPPSLWRQHYLRSTNAPLAAPRYSANPPACPRPPGPGPLLLLVLLMTAPLTHGMPSQPREKLEKISSGDRPSSGLIRIR